MLSMKHAKKLLFFLSSLAFFNCTSFLKADENEDTNSNKPEFKVGRITSRTPGDKHILVEFDVPPNIESGETLDVMRQGRSSTLVPIGWLEIKKPRKGSDTIYEGIIGQEGESSAGDLFRDYQLIMIGDILVRPTSKISQKIEIYKNIVFNLNEIFEDPDVNPETLELSPKGRELLAKELGYLKGKHLKKIIVELYTGAKGQLDQNQIESDLRAQVVKDYLKNQMEFLEDRIIAIGLGETNLKDESNIYGAEKRNRRIVIKILE